MRTPRQTKHRRAVLDALSVIPANYLLPEGTLLGDAARLVAPRPSDDELRVEIREANTALLIYGRAGEDSMRWKITEAGRAWLDENP